MLVLIRLGEFGKIPQPEWRCGHLKAVVTNKMLSLVKRLGAPELVKHLIKYYAAIKAETLAADPARWVIMARGSLLEDYAAKGVIPNEQDAWVWSMWKGYLEQESSQKMKDFFAPCRMEYIHSSGHASPEVLQRFAEAMRPKVLIPVHGETWEIHKKHFPGVHILPNETWMDL
jgi:ribonuclease J